MTSCARDVLDNMEAQLIRRDHEGLIGAAQQVEDITEHEQKKDLCTRKKRSGVQQALPPVCLRQNRVVPHQRGAR